MAKQACASWLTMSSSLVLPSSYFRLGGDGVENRVKPASEAAGPPRRHSLSFRDFPRICGPANAALASPCSEHPWRPRADSVRHWGLQEGKRRSHSPQTLSERLTVPSLQALVEARGGLGPFSLGAALLRPFRRTAAAAAARTPPTMSATRLEIGWLLLEASIGGVARRFLPK